METLALFSLVTVLSAVAGDEVVEVLARQRVGTQRKVLVGAQVIYPQSLCPMMRAGRFSVEEEDICFDALRVEDACWQAKQLAMSTA
jgi:hypothetical protein